MELYQINKCLESLELMLDEGFDVLESYARLKKEKEEIEIEKVIDRLQRHVKEGGYTANARIIKDNLLAKRQVIFGEVEEAIRMASNMELEIEELEETIRYLIEDECYENIGVLTIISYLSNYTKRAVKDILLNQEG